MSSLVTDGPEALPAILASSVLNNKRRGITGMLLYADGAVMQVIEGEKDAVMETFRDIQSDSRHTGIFVVIEEEIVSRQFAAWSMGFRLLSKEDLEKYPTAAHIFQAHLDEISQRGRAGDALTILKSFAHDSLSVA
jgi:hypothetical protein